MNIDACYIIKDDSELESLKKSIDSIKDYVRQVYVVANGQETTQIKHYIESGGYAFHYLKWDDDFSQQRNFIADQLPQDCDYYLWLDADDILIGGELLLQIATYAKKLKHDVVFLEYWYGCTFSGSPSFENLVKVDVQHFRERLIRPGTHFWKGRLHETPLPITKNNLHTKVAYKDFPIAILHTKSIESAYATMERNMRILEIQLDEERKTGEADPRTLLYLMKIYTELETPDYWNKAIDMGKEYLNKSGWDEERAMCCDLMAMCYNKLGENIKSISLLHDAIREYPHYPLLYLRLAMAYLVVGKYKSAKHWLEIGVQLPIDSSTGGITNVQEMKILSAQVLLKIKYDNEKDYGGALAAAKILAQEQPNEKNKEQLLFLQDAVDFENSCKRTDELLIYLESIGAVKEIIKVLDSLPIAITSQPFAVRWRHKVSPPRIWEKNEICYFASFGTPHFEKWDGNSLSKGIGGSETAVIELAEQWTKQGYKVTVFCDPVQFCEINGVTYLPWYHFNKNDFFNVFIQWRSGSYAPFIKCRKFLVDLHDLYSEIDLLEFNAAVDQIMVKSEYHKSLGPNLHNQSVVSNGIRV